MWVKQTRSWIIIIANFEFFLPVTGISGKSQILFLIVYVTRYLDLLTSFVSLYNSLMKVLFLASSCATVYLVYKKFKATYDQTHDTFRIEFLIAPCVLLALAINHEFAVLEVWLLSWSSLWFLQLSLFDVKNRRYSDMVMFAFINYELFVLEVCFLLSFACLVF